MTGTTKHSPPIRGSASNAMQIDVLLPLRRIPFGQSRAKPEPASGRHADDGYRHRRFIR
jgi:hypothetical protein